MACSPVALISSMDRALRPVITKVRVHFLVLDWIFSCSFSRLFFLLQRSCSLLCHYDCWSTVQNMIPLIISIFFQIIKVDLCYEIGLLRIVCQGSFLKFLHSHCPAKHQMWKWKSQNPGASGFCYRASDFVLGQVLYFGGNSNYRRTVVNPANQKGLWTSTC